MSAGHFASKAAGIAAQKMRDSFASDDTDQINRTNDNVNVEDDRTDTTSTKKDTDISGKSTTDKLKDTAYDVKEKIKDTANNIRNTSSDSQDKSKDTTHDIKNQAKDIAHDVKNTTKDVSHDIQNQSKDISYDKEEGTTTNTRTYTHKKRENSLSADSDIVTDSNQQRLNDIKEKVKGTVESPVVMAQNMYETGKEKMKEKFSRHDNNEKKYSTNSRKKPRTSSISN